MQCFDPLDQADQANSLESCGTDNPDSWFQSTPDKMWKHYATLDGGLLSMENARGSETIDLALSMVLFSDEKRAIRLVTVSKQCVTMFLTGKADFRSWMQAVREHRLYRLHETHNESDCHTQTMSSPKRALSIELTPVVTPMDSPVSQIATSATTDDTHLSPRLEQSKRECKVAIRKVELTLITLKQAKISFDTVDDDRKKTSWKYKLTHRKKVDGQKSDAFRTMSTPNMSCQDSHISSATSLHEQFLLAAQEAFEALNRTKALLEMESERLKVTSEKLKDKLSQPAQTKKVPIKTAPDAKKTSLAVKPIKQTAEPLKQPSDSPKTPEGTKHPPVDLQKLQEALQHQLEELLLQCEATGKQPVETKQQSKKLTKPREEAELTHEQVEKVAESEQRTKAQSAAITKVPHLLIPKVKEEVDADEESSSAEDSSSTDSNHTPQKLTPVQKPSPQASTEAKNKEQTTAQQQLETSAETTTAKEKPLEVVKPSTLKPLSTRKAKKQAKAKVTPLKAACQPSNQFEHRVILPAPLLIAPAPGYLQAFKEMAAIGRELARGKLPISFYEPLTTLQVMCEELYYSHLLDEACKERNSVERMNLIAAYAVSPYASTFKRSGRKPFNPLLFETFECDRWEERGWRYHSEQVVHHPHTSVCHADGKLGWSWWQEFTYQHSLSATSVEVRPISSVCVYLKEFNEYYTWCKVTTTVQNILDIRKRIMYHTGDMTVRSSNGLTCTLTFHKDNRKVNGHVTDGSGSKLSSLQGKWSDGISTVGADSKKLFTVIALPKDEHLYYGFSLFARELNELTPELKKIIPSSDSRLRPDVRLLEEGKPDQAYKQKLDLEEQQRRRNAKALHRNPLWFFKQDQATCPAWMKAPVWNSTDNYWEARDNNFANKSIPKYF